MSESDYQQLVERMLENVEGPGKYLDQD